MARVVVTNKETGEIVAERTTPFLDEYGREILDSTPMAPPIGFKSQPSMFEMVRNMVRGEALRLAAENAGAETFDEADDFEVGDDFDPTSPYEQHFDYTPLAELRRRRSEAEKPAAQAAPAAPGAHPQNAVPPSDGQSTAPGASPGTEGSGATGPAA